MNMRMALTLAFLGSTALAGAAFAAGMDAPAAKAPPAFVQMAQNDGQAGSNTGGQTGMQNDGQTGTQNDGQTGMQGGSQDKPLSDVQSEGQNDERSSATSVVPESAEGATVPAGDNPPTDQATGDAAPEAAGGGSVPAGDNPPTDQATGGVVHTPSGTEAGAGASSTAGAGEYRSYSASSNGGGAVLPAGRSAEDFIDRDIVNADGDEIGEVVDLMIDQDNKISKVVADIGGFLGLGEKRVAIDMDDITIDQSTGDLMVSMDQSQLEALPSYEEDDGVWKQSSN